MMDSFVSSGLAAIYVGIAVFFARKYIIDLISASVRFDFERKLENVRADLRAKEAEIDALRSGAFSRMDAIQTAVTARRMKAADDLWAAVVEWGKLTHVVSIMAVIKFDVASENVEREPKLQDVFKAIAPNVIDTLNRLFNLGDKDRLHLSDITWALFAAYRAIFLAAAGKAHLLGSGIDGRTFINAEGINDVLLAALPEQKAVIQAGASGHLQLLDILRNRIIEELRRTIEGAEQDAASVERAVTVNGIIAAKVRQRVQENVVNATH